MNTYDAIKMLRDAAQAFVTKVETGQAKSRESYAALKAALAATDQLTANGYILAKETVIELPDGSKELGYTLLSGVSVFPKREEVSAIIKEMHLPLGWVSMTVNQLLPGWLTHPAPVVSQASFAPVPEAQTDKEALRTAIQLRGHIHQLNDEIESLKEQLADKPTPQPVASIDTVEFRKLTSAYADAFVNGSVPETSAAWGALVAYIDARTAAPAVPELNGSTILDIVYKHGHPKESMPDQTGHSYITFGVKEIHSFAREVFALATAPQPPAAAFRAHLDKCSATVATWPDWKQRQPAAVAPEPEITARIWKREGTQEWVLELTGEIDDVAFTCRHTQPLTVAKSDVPGLPSLYLSAPDAGVRDAALDEAATLFDSSGDEHIAEAIRALKSQPPASHITGASHD